MEGLRAVGGDELRELEPHAAGIRALHSPGTGVIDFRRVAAAYADEVRARGGEILTGREVTAVRSRGAERELVTTAGPVAARNVIACAGLHADRVAALTGDAPRDHRIVPFRGDYYTLPARGAGPRQRARLSRARPVVPVPRRPLHAADRRRRPRRPERRSGPRAGGLRAHGRPRPRRGRRARLAGLLAARRAESPHGRRGGLARRRQVARLWPICSDSLPEIRAADVEFGPSGVRGQALAPRRLARRRLPPGGVPNVLHVLNAPSPAATASPAIGRHLAAQALERFFPG